MSTVHDKVLAFFSQYVHHRYGDGHIIIPAFSDAPGVFLIVSGQVKQYCMSPDGREFLVNIYKPGSLFPLMIVLTNHQNSYFFEAVGQVEVYRAPIHETLEFVKQEPEILFDLLNRLYSGMDGLIKLMTQSVTGTVQTKVVAAILMLATRFGEPRESGVILGQAFTHSDIAMLVGISRESVTRVISSLKRQKLVKVEHRKLIIPNISSLEILLK